MFIRSGVTLSETIVILGNNTNFKAVNDDLLPTGTYLQVDTAGMIRVHSSDGIEITDRYKQIPVGNYTIHTVEETFEFYEVLARISTGDTTKYTRLNIFGHTSPIIYGRKNAAGGITIVKRKEGDGHIEGQWSDISLSSEMLLAKDWIMYRGS